MDEDEKIKAVMCEKFGDDLWIKRIGHLDQVESFLVELRKNDKLLSVDELVLKDWLKFVKFIDKECSGKYYTNDKQWSELMTTMEISKKLNHLSVKFKDILRNKPLIESNALQIRSLNRIAELSYTINENINDVEKTIQTHKLEIHSFDDEESNRSRLSESVRKILDETQGKLWSKVDSIKFQLEEDESSQAPTSKNKSYHLQQCKEWTTKVNNFEVILKLWQQFLKDLLELELKLNELQTLIDVEVEETYEDKEQMKDINGKQQPKMTLTDSLIVCRRKLANVCEYRTKLLTYLRQLALAQRNTNIREAKRSINNKHVIKSTTPASSGSSFELYLVKLLSKDGKEFVNKDLVQAQLRSSIKSLDECRKNLDNLMISLRLEFGRFYFLSDHELLTIIAIDLKLILPDSSEIKTNYYKRILCKLFNNSISQFILSEDKKFVIGIKSPFMNELIELSKNEQPIVVRKRMNLYSLEVVRVFNETLRKLRRTLRGQLIESLERSSNYSIEQSASTFDWSLPVQLLVVASYVTFCRNVEQTLEKCPKDQSSSTQDTNQELKWLLKVYESTLELLSRKNGNLNLNDENSSLKDFKLSAIVSLTIHFVRCLLRLIKENVRMVQDWHWVKQVRYYLVEDEEQHEVKVNGNKHKNISRGKKIQVSIGNTKFDYKFDYLPIQCNNFDESLTTSTLKPTMEANNNTDKSPIISNHTTRATYKRLVSTTITERCLLVASHAVYHFRLGANPYGPAGGGKTETIKALGHLLGCQVIVHNCDQSNDSRSLEQLIWGLAHTGLWGCFDEFNRLSQSVVSTFSSTLELVQSSLREGRTTVELTTTNTTHCTSAASSLAASYSYDQSDEQKKQHQVMFLDKDSAFFVTLNPSDGSKYRGRRELPSNLRQLFIPIAMVRVDVGAILSESLLNLLSSGDEFSTASSLSTQEAAECGEKFSIFIDRIKKDDNFNQRIMSRCEWDLRLLMAIMHRLKLLLINEKKGLENDEKNLRESFKNGSLVDKLLVQSTAIEVQPRLSTGQFKYFIEILTQCFGYGKDDVESNRLIKSFLESLHGKDSQEFKKVATSELLKMYDDGKIVDEKETTKVIEFTKHLNNQLKTRAGVLLLGKSNSGKSTSWRLLKNINRNKVKTFAISPRSLPGHMLFGEVDQNDRKWRDGLFTALVRKALAILQQENDVVEQVWLILDGPVDSDWIESLNSVLDDNRILTLSSGERLDFNLSTTTNSSKSIKLIFETNQMKLISPATVSRLGLVYFDDDEEEECNSMQSCVKLNLKTFTKETSTNRPIYTVFDSKSAEMILERNTAGLFIVVGSSSWIKGIISEKIKGDFKFIEYSCSNTTSSLHLIELVKHFKDSDLIILNNVHLMKTHSNNNNGTSETVDTLELLRFIVTYGGFYDPLDWKFVSLQLTFIVTTAALDNESDVIIDERLRSKAAQIIITPEQFNLNSPIDQVMPLEHSDDFLKLLPVDSCQMDLLNDNIICLSEIGHGLGRKEKLKESLKETKITWEIFEFMNFKSAQESLSILERCVIGGSEVESGDNKTKKQKKSLFLLNHSECLHFDTDFRSRLFHSLNMLRIRGQSEQHYRARIYFIYLTHNITQNHQDELLLWLNTSKVYHYSHDIRREELELSFRDKFNKELVLTNSIDHYQSELLSKKLAQFVFYSSKWLVDLGEIRKIASLLQLSVNLLRKSTENICHTRKTLEVGLRRLKEFEKIVEQMKIRCDQDNERLEIKKNEMSMLMSNIDANLSDAQNKREKINTLKKEHALKTKELSLKGDKIKNELSHVLPLVEKSKLELAQHLKPEALNEIKTLRSPPKTIKDILDVIFLFLNQPDSSWSSIKSYLTRYSLKEQLSEYQFDKRLNRSLLSKVNQLIESKKESFNVQQAERASKAVVPILKWIQAALQYGQVLVELKPLQDVMERLTNESDEINNKTDSLIAEQLKLDSIISGDEARLQDLQMQYYESQQSTKRIELQLQKAEKIRSSLDERRQKWEHRLTTVHHLLSNTTSTHNNDNNELSRLCLLAASTTIMDSCLPNNLTSRHNNHVSSNLKEWIAFYGFSNEICALDVDDDSIISDEKSALHLLAKMLECVLHSYYEQSDPQQAASLSSIELLLNRQQQQQLREEEIQQLIQLLIIRLCFEVEDLIPTLIVDTSKVQITEQKLLGWLSFKEVLCTEKSLHILRCKSNNDLEVEFLEKLTFNSACENRILLIDLRHLKNFGWQTLDTFNMLTSSSSRKCKMILVLDKSLDHQDHFKHLPLRSIEPSIISEVDKVQEENPCSRMILERLIKRFNPSLSESSLEIELELKCKLNEMKQLEKRLLKQLSLTDSFDYVVEGVDATSADVDNSLNSNLVSVLNDLNDLTEALNKDITRMKEKLDELNLKKKEYQELSLDAARFFTNHLEKLGSFDKFYHVSLEWYMNLLVAQVEKSLSPKNESHSVMSSPVNYLEISERVMLSMRRVDKLKFQKQILLDYNSRLKNQNQEEQQVANYSDPSDVQAAKHLNLPRCQSSLQVHQLKQAISQLINGDDFEEAHGGVKLMIVLHDSSKSSPQLEVDEFFQVKKSNDSTIISHHYDYIKFYATGERNEQLQATLERTLSSSSDDDRYTLSNKSTTSNSEKRKKCLCIVNAQLARDWINSKLVNQLVNCRSGWKQNMIDSNEQVLIILIAEYLLAPSSSISSTHTSVFDADVLELAQVKFWYDELLLGLKDRYNQLVESAMSSINPMPRELSKTIEDELVCLVKQLVLFHLVCQELQSTPQKTSAPTAAALDKDHSNNEKEGGVAASNDLRWFKQGGYTFDYNQLSLAVKMLKKLLHDKATKEWNKMCDDQISTDKSAACYGTKKHSGSSEDEKNLAEITNNGGAGKLIEPLREMFGHYLENVIYLSRMETLEDELTISKLIERFILGATESSNTTQRSTLLSDELEEFLESECGIRNRKNDGGGG